MPTLKWLKNGNNYYYFKDAPVHISSITLNKSSISLTSAGQTEQLTATIVPSEAVEKKIHWSSSDITVATVSQTGLVTCVNPGNCTITATTNDGGYTATCSVKKQQYIDYILVGGGGGGGGGQPWLCDSNSGGGGGGGEVVLGNFIFCSGITCCVAVSIGTGGGGGYCYCAGTSGGDTCFGSIVAKGGEGGQTAWTSSRGGNSGSGCTGGPAMNGGGGGASGNGASGDARTGGQGGTGICGYGGGGGGGGYGTGGIGCDGGGNGGTSATNYGGGGGGGNAIYSRYSGSTGGAGCQGVAIICYKTGDICATGGTVTTSGDYTVHTFTSDGIFCIIS